MEDKRNFEHRLLEIILTWRSPRRNRWMIFLTHLGTGGFIWFIIAGIFILDQDYGMAGFNMILSMACSVFFCNILLKPLIKRDRPSWREDVPLLIGNPKDYSFPSGHTTSSFAAATTLLFYNQPLAMVLLTIATLIALSRIYHYVHYPSDVIAGILLGIFCAYLGKYIFDRYFLEFLSARSLIKGLEIL